MKKNIIIVVLIILCVTFGIVAFSREEVEDGFNDVSQVNHEHMLSMMLEQTAGAGDYSLETRSSWPTKEDGYVFNSTLSKCERGSKLRWDEENNIVVMVGTTSDKCYVYFDKILLLTEWVKLQYTGTQGENNLYYHDSTLENGAEDNSYRYAGSSDTTNNFVCFGSDAQTCPIDNLYRIIGVVGDQVKIIKSDYATISQLGDGYGVACSNNGNCDSNSTVRAYYWNQTGINSWNTSELNTINLNTNFLNNIGTPWSNKIATTTWKVGGSTYNNIYNTASVAYTNEYTNPAESITETAKIGLMYTSDYGFAAASTAWATTLFDYNGNDASGNKIIDENWMHMGLPEWTIVRMSDTTAVSFVVQSSGGVYVAEVNRTSVVEVGYPTARPVFHLNSDVTYVSGSGTKEDSIRIN